MTTPERSAIVATVRNERETITEFIESLLNQSEHPDQIIIVDGESTDGTREILETYSRKNLLHVISAKCNIAEGRNIGITAAEAELICITDAGCKVDENWLSSLLQCFRNKPETDVVAGNFRFETHSAFEESVVLATFPPNRDDLPAARYYPSSRSLAVRKSAWARAGGYPEWLYAAEDTLFNIRLRQIGCQFDFARGAIVRWRPRETWKALARQRLNFSRGNARVGIGLNGYRQNIRTHSLVLLCLAASIYFYPASILALYIFVRHAKRNLVPQARIATNGNTRMFLRTLITMEFVRLVNIFGYIQGRMDRHRDPTFITSQKNYMGTDCADSINFNET